MSFRASTYLATLSSFLWRQSLMTSRRGYLVAWLNPSLPVCLPSLKPELAEPSVS